MKYLGSIFVAAFFIIVLVLSFVYLGMRNDTAYTETLECQVVDKYSQRSHHTNVGIAGRRYYIVVHANGTYAEVQDSIRVSQEAFYEQIKIGDTITCTVTCDEHGVLELNVESWD